MAPNEPAEALVQRAIEVDQVQAELRALAEGRTPEELSSALDLAMDQREADAATNLALALLCVGATAPADVVERLYGDAVDERAGNVLLATHPERVAIFERLFTSRRADRYQLAMAAALYTHLGLETTPTLLALLRSLARNRIEWVGAHWAEQAAVRVGGDELGLLFRGDGPPIQLDRSLFAELGAEPTFASLRTERSKVLASGFTAHRVKPKLGRNEPCDCGSGKKYKKCCAKKAGERVRLSPVAGLTMREYRQRLHEYLDAETLMRRHPADLALLPFDELSVEQLDAVFQVFLECERMELAEEILERLCARESVTDEDRDNVRAFFLSFAHDWGHEALVARHVPRFVDPARVPAYLQLGHSIRNPDEQTLALIEAECRRYVVDGEVSAFDAAYELLLAYPALGVLVARGSLDVAYVQESWTLLEEIEAARDRLGAPPNDPFWSVYDGMLSDQKLARASDEEKEALRAEVERARVEAAEARAQAHLLVRDLGLYERELAELEARATEAEARAEARSSIADVAEEAQQASAAKALRRKIRELEGRIREGQRERADLRRRAQEAVAGSRAEPAARRAPSAEEPREEPTTATAVRGLRVPVWSDKATSSLEKLPRNIASAAIAMAGALGAGRPEAWRQAKRLEGMHGLCSARLGLHHRLLFWIETDDVLDVDEVVTREGLDRALAVRR